MILAGLNHHTYVTDASIFWSYGHAFKFVLVLKVNSKDKNKVICNLKHHLDGGLWCFVSFADVSNASIL